MEFNQMLNKYIETVNCTAKDISVISKISTATISRYRSGDRIPEVNTEIFENLCNALAIIAKNKNIEKLTKDSIINNFLKCPNVRTTDKKHLRENLNTLLSVLNISIAKLCKYTNYDTSTIFRIRNGTRQPSEPDKFATRIATCIADNTKSTSSQEILAELLHCSVESISNDNNRIEKIKAWLFDNHGTNENDISSFFTKLNEFDLNEYIKVIQFDKLKVPTVPFQFPTSKSYFGLKAMMESELDFLKATVLSKSMSPVIMYSDMPMETMAKDAEFPKKWMFGMAMMLKKGLHLNMIHNVDRPFHEMMLGLESYIPMYMTGQISPYYIKPPQNCVFLHLLKVSGNAALSGEAIVGHHNDGKYYLTKSKDEVSYYNKRAMALLDTASPLMDIFRESNSRSLNAFLLSDSHIQSSRKNTLSSLPLYTMDENLLISILKRNYVPERDIDKILTHFKLLTQITKNILTSSPIEDNVPFLTKEEFELFPISLSLSEVFYEKEIFYTFEEFLEHMKQSKKYALNHPNYTINQTSAHIFRNLQISIHKGQWAMISKNKAPAIHFVIRHAKMRKAIEDFIPPVVEN